MLSKVRKALFPTQIFTTCKYNLSQDVRNSSSGFPAEEAVTGRAGQGCVCAHWVSCALTAFGHVAVYAPVQWQALLLGSTETQQKSPGRQVTACTQLTVFLSFYAQLDVIIIFSPIRSVVYLFTLDIGLQRKGHGVSIIRQNPVGVLKYLKIVLGEGATYHHFASE